MTDKNKRQAMILRILNIGFMALLVATVIVLSVLLHYTGKNEQILEEAVATVATVEKPQFETIKRYAREPFNLTAYAPLFNEDMSEKVLFNDGSMGEVWLPLLTDVPLNTLENSNYYMAENGFKYYVQGNEIQSLVGIDVSEHNGVIDWKKVKAAGVDFAFIRVGVRTYGGGDAELDDNYKTNIKGAIAAGIKVGVYFFSQAITVEEAVEESDMLLDAIAPYDITFPVVYDWEIISGDDARTDIVKVEDFTDLAIAFCENVKNNGYVPMIYTSLRLSYLKYDLSRLTAYDFWLANWTDETSYYYKYNIWQYASDGTVDGISGNVDLNIAVVDYSGELSEPIPVSAVFKTFPPIELPAVTTTAN
jgi:GH25 family lysozyme M1 (1,4-beta-N-acetylmuramidase)